MGERDRRRLGRERAQRRGELLGLLRREPALGPRRERRRAEAEEAVALGLEPLREPRRRLLGAPVLGEPAGELLGGLLGLELGELGVLVGEELARLQLEQRRDEDEELAAGVEIELVALGEPLEERDDDLGDVDLRQVELLLRTSVSSRSNGPSNASRSSSSSRTQHRAHASGPVGRVPSGPPSPAASAPACAGPSAGAGRAGAATRRRSRSRRRRATSETQKFSRSPRKWCDGSIRRSSSNMRRSE